MSRSEASGAERPTSSGIPWRIAVPVVIGVLVFAALWYTVFSAMTAALVASGGAIALVAGASASDAAENLLDMLARLILGILAVIGAFFAAILSILG